MRIKLYTHSSLCDILKKQITFPKKDFNGRRMLMINVKQKFWVQKRLLSARHVYVLYKNIPNINRDYLRV